MRSGKSGGKISGQIVVVPSALYFASYRLDARARLLWQGDQLVRLTPKAFGVLDYLARHADRLVTKHELLDHIWPDVNVGDAVLKVAIREIRQALDDDTSQPRFVQTARRVGYRFLADVSVEPPGTASRIEERPTLVAKAPAATSLIGREAPRHVLEASLVRAMAGTRQVVFVVGEAGIGKTSLVEDFLVAVERKGRVRVARGQCMEHAGGAEAHLPVLDALGRLARTDAHDDLLAVVGRYAPTWLAQLPALADDAAGLRREIFGATNERMLREIAEALEVLTKDVSLVIFLDDLHWSDDATLDFVSRIARRSEPARLLLVCTYRPVDVVLNRPALKIMKQELVAKGLSQEIPLGFLTPDDASAFLETRFPHHNFPVGLTDLLHQRSGGNPLFMTNLMAYLVAKGMIDDRAGRWELRTLLETVASASPETLRQVIDAQLGRLTPEERAALEAASVCGIGFPGFGVAAALGVSDEKAEAILEVLAGRGQFIEALGLVDLPQRAWSPRYQFVHSLHQEVLYLRLPAARRVRLHQRVAERLEHVYGTQADQVASELAEHFDQARDYSKAVAYMRAAAANETRRFANREAMRWLDRAITLADRLPAGQRDEPAIGALTDLGRVKRSMGDMSGSSQAFLEAARRARDRQDASAEMEALLLAASALTWFERVSCLSTAHRAQELADGIGSTTAVFVRGYSAYWSMLWDRWRDDDAQACEDALALARETQHPLRLFSMLPRCAYARAAQGRYADAAAAAAEGADRALAADDAFGQMVCQFYGAWAEILAGRWGAADSLLTESLGLADRNGHRSWQLLFTSVRAWLLREAGAFHSARDLARRAAEDARTLGVPLGQLVAQTQLGLTLLETEPPAAALDILHAIASRIDQESMLMAAPWHMQIRIGLSVGQQRIGAYDEAAAEARRACELAAISGEATSLALAWTAVAEQALARQQLAEANEAVGRALQAVADADAPVAAWRVHACAARLSLAEGRRDDARSHRERAASTITRLAESLPADSDLRRTFLERSDVRWAIA